MATLPPQTTSSRCKHCGPATCPPASKLLGAPGSRLRRPSLRTWFCGSTNPTVLWWTTANPTCRLRSWDATLHRLLSMNLSCFSYHHAARTWPRWPPGPSSRAYLCLYSSEALQGIDLSRLLFTCTNTNQVATCTCNTWPRVSPHHVVNH
jgi:hypothetical protein